MELETTVSEHYADLTERMEKFGGDLLDVGCGIGGTAITLAKTYGVSVTGLTICEPHIAVATQHAEQRGVGHLVNFRYGDFMDLPFPDAGFVDIWETNLSSEATTATKLLRDGWLLLTLMNHRSGGLNAASRELMEATVGYDRGLRDIVFTYHFLSAARPA